MKKTLLKNAAVAAIAVTGAGIAAPARADVVYLNGQPLNTSVAPIQRNGRTLVPMRDIFEALGATVSYDALTKGISAERATTKIAMQLGNSTALLNGQRVILDEPAQSFQGRTLVPLRFVSEAMGATVSYDASRRIVMIGNGAPGAIATNPNTGSGTAVAGARTISVPSKTVVTVTLDQALSSQTAVRGDKFSSTVVSNRAGDSEFPAGTRLEGTVVGVTRKTGSEPGTLDLRFTNIILPNGQSYQTIGRLIDINDSNSVQSVGQGRVVAKPASRNNQLKVIGIGAAAGYGIGRLLKKNGVVSAILGAGAGFLFDRSQKNSVREAVVPAGTRIGVRLDRAVTYADYNGYADQRAGYVGS